jgi:hypothetical protein
MVRRFVGWGTALVGVALGVACGPNVAVDGPGTGSNGQGATGTSTATTTTTSGAGGGSGGGAPGCPATRPVDGTACEKGLTCTYGDESCSNSFMCPEGTWMTDHHVCPPTCPASLPSPQSSCGVEGLSCDYPQGQYHCSGETAQCANGQWEVSGYTSSCVTCDAAPPEEGTSCNPCCPYDCTYPTDGCPDLVVSCVPDAGGATWHRTGGCPPPPNVFCQGASGPAACEQMPSCRWLQPGCGESPIPQKGCYPKDDCVAGQACADPSQACTTVDFDPCYKGDCNACSKSASVCL